MDQTRSPKKQLLKLGLLVILILTASAVIVGAVFVWGFSSLNCSLTIRYLWYSEIIRLRDAHPEGIYPAMSATPGALFLPFDAVSQQFVEQGDLFCVKADSSYTSLPVEQQFAAPTYTYFGYALASEDEILAFLESYPRFVEVGASFESDLPAPPGRGSFGGDQFLRLRKGLWEELRNSDTAIPLIFEIPDYGSSGMEFRHWNRNTTVLFLQSNLEFVPFGEGRVITPAVLEKIGEIKALYQK